MAKETKDLLSEYMEISENAPVEDEAFIVDTAEELSRLGGLLEILGSLGYDGTLMMDGEGLPYIDVEIEGDLIRFIYVTAGAGSDEYFLQISGTVMTFEEEEELDLGKALLCENFNQGSIFGFAVYHPFDGEIELRAQTYEEGGLSEPETYKRLIEHYFDAAAEFTDLLEEQENQVL